jgi:hypothetical protein
VFLSAASIVLRECAAMRNNPAFFSEARRPTYAIIMGLELGLGLGLELGLELELGLLRGG